MNKQTVSADLFAFIYGAFVRQLIDDLDDIRQVNERLRQIGNRIGKRLIDEFYAFSNITTAATTLEVATRNICEKAIPMFLATSAVYEFFPANEAKESYPRAVIKIAENPMLRWVVIPEEWGTLDYNGLLAGTVEGALEEIGMNVVCTSKQETGKPTSTTLTVELRSVDHEIFEEQEGA